MSHIRSYKGIPLAVVTDDGKVRTIQERPEDREFFDSEGFVGVKPPYDPEVPATNDPMPSDIQQAVAVLTKCIGNETAAWNTWNNINTDAGFVTAFMRLHASELPADEGKLPDWMPRDLVLRMVTEGVKQGYAEAQKDHATELQKARAEAVKGVLSDYRHRVQAAFEWPNPEHAMSTLAEIEFAMLAERFAIRSQEPPTGQEQP